MRCAARADRSEVLTANTLIRVAIDLLLTHADELHGDTEDQVCDSQTPGVTDLTPSVLVASHGAVSGPGLSRSKRQVGQSTKIRLRANAPRKRRS